MTEARNRTYTAEDTVWTGPKAKKHRQPIATADVRELMDGLGIGGCSLKRVSSHAGAYRRHKKMITLGRMAPAWVAYHEMAHALADSHNHDAVFRREYVRVVRAALGDWWADRLELAFRRAKLPVAP